MGGPCWRVISANGGTLEAADISVRYLRAFALGHLDDIILPRGPGVMMPDTQPNVGTGSDLRIVFRDAIHAYIRADLQKAGQRMRAPLLAMHYQRLRSVENEFEASPRCAPKPWSESTMWRQQRVIWLATFTPARLSCNSACPGPLQRARW